MNLQKVLFLPKNILKCNLHTSAAMNKIQAGRYKVTRDRSKPLTYEESFWPEQIAIKKGMGWSMRCYLRNFVIEGFDQPSTQKLAVF